MLNKFLAASLEAKQLMKTSDAVWDKLKPKMRAAWCDVDAIPGARSLGVVPRNAGRSCEGHDRTA